jgi:DNA-directed RNA polymerase subunit RPC12/RpoP
MIWEWECPKCGAENQNRTLPKVTDLIMCGHCQTPIFAMDVCFTEEDEDCL